MANLSIHKSGIARRLVEEKGCQYLPLPEYSPDLNPIEKMWSKIKHILRGRKARTREELDKAIDFALENVTPEDAEGRFTSCGYIKKLGCVSLNCCFLRLCNVLKLWKIFKLKFFGKGSGGEPFFQKRFPPEISTIKLNRAKN